MKRHGSFVVMHSIYIRADDDGVPEGNRTCCVIKRVCRFTVVFIWKCRLQVWATLVMHRGLEQLLPAVLAISLRRSTCKAAAR
jgi:hypothetical protein